MLLYPLSNFIIIFNKICTLLLSIMPDENSWRTTLSSTSNTTSTEPTVVRPDTLNIGASSISVDFLTPQILQFLQNPQSVAASSTSTPDAKFLEYVLVYLDFVSFDVYFDFLAV